MKSTPKAHLKATKHHNPIAGEGLSDCRYATLFRGLISQICVSGVTYTSNIHRKIHASGNSQKLVANIRIAFLKDILSVPIPSPITKSTRVLCLIKPLFLLRAVRRNRRSTFQASYALL